MSDMTLHGTCWRTDSPCFIVDGKNCVEIECVEKDLEVCKERNKIHQIEEITQEKGSTSLNT